MLKQEIRVDVIAASSTIELQNEIIRATSELRDNPDWEFEVENIQYVSTKKSEYFRPNLKGYVDMQTREVIEYSALIYYKAWPIVQVQQG